MYMYVYDKRKCMLVTNVVCVGSDLNVAGSGCSCEGGGLCPQLPV